jgi:predicted TIM-barrel fold metal-dependent hydrolase
MDTGIPQTHENPIKEIDVRTNTRDVLSNAEKYLKRHKLEDVFICDIDSHHMEIEAWREIVKYISSPVVRDHAERYANFTGAPPFGINGDLGLLYQDVGGRIPHQTSQREDVPAGPDHRHLVLAQRARQAMGIHYQVLFPTPMLMLGVHPQPEMEVMLSEAYNQWLIDNVLSKDDRLKTLLFIPFNTPKECERFVEKFTGQPGVLGFMVTSVRHKPVHHDNYMRLYRMIEERGLALGFHAGYYWNEESMRQINRFGAMHALSFAWCNIVHMTNWVWNGLGERFPKLRPMWIESGIAWVPWLMQRLDHQYMMRSSEAPLLKRPPGDYMREMYYTCQPMETDYPKAVECTFEMINARTQLLYASDWPHWDFDTPSVIWDLPFLNEQDKRNILGLNAARAFNLEVPDKFKTKV